MELYTRGPIPPRGSWDYQRPRDLPKWPRPLKGSWPMFHPPGEDHEAELAKLRGWLARPS